MTRQMTRTIGITAAIAGVLLALPGRADAQRVQVDVKVSAEVGREIRQAVREATSGLNDAWRDLGRELGRDLSRDLGRELGRLGAEIGAWGWDGGWTGDAGQQQDWGQPRDWRGRATDRQTRTLAIGPNGTLELNNLSGDITVTVGGSREASVELIRESRGRTDADAKTGLARVTVDSRVVGTRATVKTDYPNERQSNYSVSVDMNVTVPAGTRVVVHSVSADVKVTGVRGELSVTTISGDLTLTDVGAVAEAKTASGDVKITGSMGDATLDAGTLSGDVILLQVKARRITASTVSGSVSARDVLCDSATLSTMSGDAIFLGELARNGRYEVTSHSGDVRFSPTGSVGFVLTASSFGGDITSSLPLQTENTRTRRRSLSGKVGDGSATVTLQTFNGDITVGAKK
jgi:DUF4097 and DUF4098 domain-containing protein YvlB